jgi:putative oxidoreductase
MAIFSSLSKHHHTGLLILRIGIGVMMILHGYPKLLGGTEKWAGLGKSMSVFGMHDFPTFWGFMAAFAETIGGLLFLVGFLFRPAVFMLLITMIVATMRHIKGGDGIMGASHAIELAILFLSMFIIGPGKYSIDKN